MSRPTHLLLTTLLLAAAACGRDPTGTTFDAARETVTGDVEASLVAGGVRVVNRTDRGIAYSVWNPNYMGLMGVCEEPGPPCVRLASGASVVVPEGEFHGWALVPAGAPSFPRALELRWWHVLPRGASGYAASAVHVIPLVP